MSAAYHTPSRPRFLPLLAILITAAHAPSALAQPVTTPWGNIDGIVVDGQRMEIGTSLRALDPDWSGFVQSSKYNWEGLPTFTLEGKTYTCSHFLEGTQLHYTTRVTDTGRATARVDLHTGLAEALPMAGAFFCVDLPADFAGGRLEILGAPDATLPTLPDSSGKAVELLRAQGTGFKITTGEHTITVSASASTQIILRQDFVDLPSYLNTPRPRMRFTKSDPLLARAPYQVYFAVMPGKASVGTQADTSYSISVDGKIDTAPVRLTLDATRPGRAFDGIGGNFRMQFPDLDPQVVDYCLQNLDVAWGRIAFPWDEWQPDESHTQAEAILEGRMSPFFRRQMEMARQLAARGIPVMVGVWNPPPWAIDASVKLPKGVKLDPRKYDRMAESIADYLEFLKAHLGVEVLLFSFNETDYGVEVHQSPQEHASMNRALGECFARRGLVTKMIAGDTGAGTAQASRLAVPSLEDPSQRVYLGATAFHTYHGITAADLEAWSTAAAAANLPLLVTEGGRDSAAHRYPLIFTTPWFAQQEIDDNIRIGAACQPATIMPWQLNADYSVLAGGGIYGDNGPLRPTQRFWGLKQLGSMRPGSFWLPITTDSPAISCAALGDIANNTYAVHIVNNGASRSATVSGIPAGVHKLRVVVTDATRGMETLSTKGVVDGSVTFHLPAQSFTSLLPAL